jgi:CubicO group peptidase (beta-lactamase class C family)
MRPRDLLRIGRLVRDRGSWGPKQIVASSWIDRSMGSPSTLFPCYAMEWWVLRDGCDATTGGHPPLGRDQGFYADGYGGQYITIVPSTNVVSVRTTTPPPAGLSDDDYTRITFGAFPHEAATFVRH